MAHSSMKLSLVQNPLPEGKQVKIAFATSDNELVNEHFGSATQFSIYAICVESFQLIELIEFTKTPAGHNEDKLKVRVDALTECRAIYCNAIGMSAIKQLLAIQIKPINVDAGSEIKSILSELQVAWQSNPDYWLATGAMTNNTKVNKGMANKAQSQTLPNANDKERLANLLDEEWEL